MGNCFLVSNFNEQTKEDLKPFKRKDGFYELRFNFKDLYLNPITDFYDTSYIVVFLFSDYEFINTYIYKKTCHNNKVFVSRIENFKNNPYFLKKMSHFNSMYINITSLIIFPTIECIQKINDRLLTEMFDNFFNLKT